ncbi:MAG: hypothetical protein IKU60_00260 [Clostridia bacterium]|nr:hypothetical protein [Clostridia bacterium]
MATVIKERGSYDKGGYRDIFDVDTKESRLKVYIKSNLTVHDVPLVNEAVIEKEEFCASKFTFSVLKDDVMSFNEGDAVSVKFDGEGIFFGYVFTKVRDKENVITVTCYDQLRYLKNRRSYTRGRMSTEEVIRKIASDCALRVGEIDRCNVMLPSVAADNVSLLDVIRKACKDTESLSGKKYIFYDDYGKLYLKAEEGLISDILIDSSLAENYVYKDSIDNGVYNTVQLYSDTKRLNLRSLTTVSDKENMDKWGTLILSKKVTDPERSYDEARMLLKEYNRVQREIVIKGVDGDFRLSPGWRFYLDMTMGDLAFDGYVRIRKALHRFENNCYRTDIYVDGSEVE